MAKKKRTTTTLNPQATPVSLTEQQLNMALEQCGDFMAIADTLRPLMKSVVRAITILDRFPGDHSPERRKLVEIAAAASEFCGFADRISEELFKPEFDGTIASEWGLILRCWKLNESVSEGTRQEDQLWCEIDRFSWLPERSHWNAARHQDA
jgi:hypothetical protein